MIAEEMTSPISEPIAEKLTSSIDETVRAHDYKMPMSLEFLTEILGTTIKCNDATKTLCFLYMLLNYTDCEQVNLGFHGESSSGKTYIAQEVAGYFPKEDVLKIAYASPSSFYYGEGVWDKDKKALFVNLHQKILIFQDQPHDDLLKRLRPLLSHDEKEIMIQVADRNNRGSLKTKNVVLIGFPTVVFCSARLSLDEQERTRMIFLSPETGQNTLLETLPYTAEKMGNRELTKMMLEENPEYRFLKKRVCEIKKRGIIDVLICNSKAVAARFIKERGQLIPRHNRDLKYLMMLIKAFALLNCWDRQMMTNGCIAANDEDIENGFKLYSEISPSNELGISPEVYDIFLKVFKPLFEDSLGVPLKDVASRYLEVYGRPLSDYRLRREIVPILENAGLIREEPDENDKRRICLWLNESREAASDRANRYGEKVLSAEWERREKIYR